MRWIFSRNFSYNKYRKYPVWKLFYMINNYINYIIISHDWVYYNYFKRKKVINYEFNAHKRLVNHSFNYPFKPKFSKLSRRSFSTVSSSLKTDVCTQNNTIALNLLPGWVTGFSDGEGSFSVNIVKNSQYKTG